MKAVVVIDMIRDFIEPSGALYCGETAEEIIAPIMSRLHEARKNDELVIFACDNHEENDPEFEKYLPHAVTGTKGAEIIDDLSSYDGRRLYIAKTTHSAFKGTALEVLLRNANVNELILCGVCTDICVKATLEDALKGKYKVTVHEDEVASFDVEAHKNALEEFKTMENVTVLTATNE